jgi:predicted CopG family antitoxin
VAVKTITIDMEAYEKLAREKKDGESFSQVIKRILGARRMTAEKLLANAKSLSVSEDALNRMEEIVQERERDLVRAPDLAFRPL